ncbi:MAG TPA: hypothetical protein VFB23_02590 [Candidatus Acidoferrales bacterium]|nr:hypothetical protein [Candidatus Acidoferrales bacterium]
MPKKRRATKKAVRRKTKATKKARNAERQLEAEVGKLPGAPTPAK